MCDYPLSHTQTITVEPAPPPAFVSTPADTTISCADADSLVVNAPRLFELGESCDAAFRPVHHQNIGSAADEPLDAFWKEVYRTVGLSNAPYTVESYVDSVSLRPYFNTHCFATRPSTGLCRAWWEHFQAMVSDARFQAGPCAGEMHKVFLHQAVLSTLVARA